MADRDELPDYARCLCLEHTTFAADLRRMLTDLVQAAFTQHPTKGDATAEKAAASRREIADIACGDGFFSRLLAEIDPRHHVVGFDNNEAYLSAARLSAARLSSARLSAARTGNPPTLADRLSFELCDLLQPEQAHPFEESFDALFCIDSLESIEDHGTLIEQMVRLCRPGGIVVVAETDNLHDLIGSWPPEIENLLHRLEWEGLAEGERKGYAFPRYGSALLHSAGLREITVRSYTFDRSGPLDDSVRGWLAEYFPARLAAISGGTAEELAQLRRHLHPNGEKYFADSPDALLTYLRFCILGRKPA